MNILNLCDDVLGLIEHQTGILRETKTNKINMNTVIKQISGGFEYLLYDKLWDNEQNLFGGAVLRHYEVSEWVKPGDVLQGEAENFLNDFTP